MNTTDQPFHVPVLLEESIQSLDLHAGDVVVDGTFGGGGHSGALLAACPDITLICVDLDESAKERFEASVLAQKALFVQSNFKDADVILAAALKDHADKVLLDLGHHRGLADRHEEILVGRNLLLLAPEVDVLEHHHRVVIADRGLEQALGIGRIRRRQNLQPRRVHEQWIGAVGMLGQQGRFARGVGEGQVDDVHRQQVGLARVKAALVHVHLGNVGRGDAQDLDGLGAQRVQRVLGGIGRHGCQRQLDFGKADHGLAGPCRSGGGNVVGLVF